MQQFEPQPKVRIAAVRLRAQRVALAQQRGQLGRDARHAHRHGAKHHVRETRMQAERRHPDTEPCGASLGIDGLEPDEQLAGLRQWRSGRRVDPIERIGIGRAPAGELERERGKIGLEDLRRRMRGQRGVRRLAPKPIADARRGTARASAPLVRGRLRDPAQLKAAHPGHRVERGTPFVPAVDDDSHALDRQTGLGDVCREHNLAASVRFGAQRRVLLRRGELAVERPDAQRIRAGQTRQGLRRAADLAGARQKREQVALVVGERAPDDRHHAAIQALVLATGGRWQVDRSHREHPSRRSNDRGIAEHTRQARGIEGRGHDQDPQILAQLRLRIERKREPEVGLQAALVKLIEDHATRSFERRVALQHPREDTFGHDFDPGAAPDTRVCARAVANGRPACFSERVRHPFRHRTRGHATRLEHHDATGSQPAGLQQGERHDRALARTGRCRQHRNAVLGERRLQRRQGIEDG